MKGIIHSLPNGHKSYEVLQADEPFIFNMATVLKDKMGFSGEKNPKLLLDKGYIDMYKNNIKLTVGYDNFSGCFVMAYCDDGDNEIVKFKNHFDKYLENLEI